MIQELPGKNFVPQLQKFVAAAIDKNGWSLRCDDLVLETSEIAGHDGLLPLIMWVTGNTIEKIWGPQDLSFRLNSDALCGVTLECDRGILPLAVWLHAVHYELEKASLDPNVSQVMTAWFNDWNEAMAKKSIRLFPPNVQAPRSI